MVREEEGASRLCLCFVIVIVIVIVIERKDLKRVIAASECTLYSARSVLLVSSQCRLILPAAGCTLVPSPASFALAVRVCFHRPSVFSILT